MGSTAFTVPRPLVYIRCGNVNSCVYTSIVPLTVTTWKPPTSLSGVSVWTTSLAVVFAGPLGGQVYAGHVPSTSPGLHLPRKPPTVDIADALHPIQSPLLSHVTMRSLESMLPALLAAPYSHRCLHRLCFPPGLTTLHRPSRAPYHRVGVGLRGSLLPTLTRTTTPHFHPTAFCLHCTSHTCPIHWLVFGPPADSACRELLPLGFQLTPACAPGSPSPITTSVHLHPLTLAAHPLL